MQRLLYLLLVAGVMACSATTAVSQERDTENKKVKLADRDAQAIKPPNLKPLYNAVFHARQEAICEVRFDIQVDGKPFNLEADCNKTSFEKHAIKSVETARFSPKIVDGAPKVRTNVVYPIEIVFQRPGQAKAPECYGQDSSKSERARVTRYRRAVNRNDTEASQQIRDKIRLHKLFCVQRHTVLLYEAKAKGMSGDFEGAMTILDQIRSERRETRKSSDRYLDATLANMGKWVKTNRQLEQRSIEDSAAELISPPCWSDIHKAFKETKVTESCKAFVDVNAYGLPTNINTTCQTADHDEAAVSAASCMLFTPPTQGGERSPGSTLSVAFDFKPRE